MLKITLLICSFVLPILADEANHNSFLDTGGISLPKVGATIPNPNDASDNPPQVSSKNLIIPTLPDQESQVRTDVIPNPSINKPAILPPSSSKTDSSQTASKPSVKIPLPETPIIKPEPEVAAATKPEIQKPIQKPLAPNLPPPGPRTKVTPTLPPPGPQKNMLAIQPSQTQTAQQGPSLKPEESPMESTSHVTPVILNTQQLDKSQSQISNISQQVQKPDNSNLRPQKTPIPKPLGWTLKEKIKSYSIIKKPIRKYPDQVPHALEPNQLQTAEAKKPSWSFKKKKNVHTTQHASKNSSQKPAWSFKKIWSFKKKGKALNLEPIDLTPAKQLIQQAKALEEDTKKPAYITKPRKIQTASHTRPYSIKEKGHDVKEKQSLDFEKQELKVIKAKDYDDSLDRLRYNEYVKLFWSKFSTKRERERAADIKSYLENYYKYHLDKKQKHRN